MFLFLTQIIKCICSLIFCSTSSRPEKCLCHHHHPPRTREKKKNEKYSAYAYCTRHFTLAVLFLTKKYILLIFYNFYNRAAQTLDATARFVLSLFILTFLFTHKNNNSQHHTKQNQWPLVGKVLVPCLSFSIPGLFH